MMTEYYDMFAYVNSSTDASTEKVPVTYNICIRVAPSLFKLYYETRKDKENALQQLNLRPRVDMNASLVCTS